MRTVVTRDPEEAAAFVRTDQALQAPDLELIFAPVLYEEGGAVPPSAHGVTVAAVLLQPRSSGTVTLRSADPADPPIIDPGYLSQPADLPRIRRGLHQARDLLATAALRPYAGAPMSPWPGPVDDRELDRFVRYHAETLYHPVGTCRMGRDPLAVVDAELRVHGLTGLRVVDASVIPTIPRGHPHASTTMIAPCSCAQVESHSIGLIVPSELETRPVATTFTLPAEVNSSRLSSRSSPPSSRGTVKRCGWPPPIGTLINRSFATKTTRSPEAVIWNAS